MNGDYEIEFYLITMIIYLSNYLDEISLNCIENKLQISPKEFIVFTDSCLFVFFQIFLIISWNSCILCHQNSVIPGDSILDETMKSYLTHKLLKLHSDSTK